MSRVIQSGLFRILPSSTRHTRSVSSRFRLPVFSAVKTHIHRPQNRVFSLLRGPQAAVLLALVVSSGVRALADSSVDVFTLPTWSAVSAERKAKGTLGSVPVDMRQQQQPVDKELNDKIVLWRGDITSLKIDAIVNAANSALLPGGGVCGAIHRAAGRELAEECRSIGGCQTGQTVITQGYNLPSKYVLHSVGPTNGDAKLLASCYRTCLDVAVENGVRTLAFCCISTGIYGFDNEKAAAIALSTTRQWLSESDNRKKIDRIVFCTFLDVDVRLYNQYTAVFFPVESADKREL